MVATQTITIAIDAQAAQIYYQASTEERRKLDTLLSLRFSAAIKSRRPLEEIMRDISCKAQARGLTPEILEELLQDD